MNRSFIPILMLLSLLLARCAREVMIELPEEESKAVIVSHFLPGEPFKVRVTLSQTIYDTRDPIVPENADVTILKEGTTFDKLTRTTDDFGNVYWRSQKLAETGTSYSIAVQVDGYPLAEASSAIPVFSPIKPIQLDTAAITETLLSDGRRLMNIPLKLELENLPAEKRYFAFYLKHDIEVTDDNGTTIYEGLPTNYSSDGRTLSLLHDIAEPAVLINEKFWSDNLDSLRLDALIPYNPITKEKPRRLYIEWRTLSEEFYKYHLSLDRQGSNLPLSDPDALYNNVTGGYGNFSGYSVWVQMIELPF